MIVVSDTIPAIPIGQIELLPRLYGRAIIPRTVALELQHLRAPAAVRMWTESQPAWQEIRIVHVVEESGPLLDAGQLAPLSLAITLHVDIVLIDDRNGYNDWKQPQTALVTRTYGNPSHHGVRSGVVLG